MSDNDDIHKLLEGQARLETKIDASDVLQHSIKESIEQIQDELKTTSKETTINQEQIKNLEKQFYEYRVAQEKSHERIYENLDKKENVIMNKVKVWVLGGIVSFIITISLIYLKG